MFLKSIRNGLWVVLLFAVATTLSAKIVDKVAVIINQEAITAGELDEAVGTYYQSQGMQIPSKGGAEYQKTRKGLIRALIEKIVLAQEADRMNLVVSDREINRMVEDETDKIRSRFSNAKEFEQGLQNEGITLEEYKIELKDRLLRELKSNRALQAKSEELKLTFAVSDDDAKAYYKKHTADFDQVKFSVIMFRIPANEGQAYADTLKKQAEGLLKELQGGADFSTYAKKYCEDPDLKTKGGDVGTLYRYQVKAISKDLAQGVFGMVAKSMGIITAPDALFIVKVQNRIPVSYANAVMAVKSLLKNEKRGAALQEWVENLKKNAYVKEMK